MKNLVVGLFFIAGSFAATAQDMTVDQIVDNYFENIGGREAWSKIESYQMNATADAQGMTIPVTVINQKDGKTITKFTVQGQELVQGAFDGENMWSISFMTMKPELAESEQTENHKRSIGEFPDPLLTYKDMGYTLELDGEDTKEGVDCYKLKLTKTKQLVDGEEKDNVVYYYMDKENFVPIVQEQEIPSGQMAGKISQTMFSDYQEVDGGLYYPFSITSGIEGMGGQSITLQSLEINPELDQSVFDFPEEEEK